MIQTLTGHTRRVVALTVFQNGNLVSGSADTTIKVWNPRTGALIQTLTGHTSAVEALTVCSSEWQFFFWIISRIKDMGLKII